MTSAEPGDIRNVKVTRAPQGFLLKELKDVYYTDIRGDHGNSGGPVFSVSDGSVLGMSVRTINPSDSSVLTVLVPASHVINLLDKNGIGWTKAN